MNPRGPFRTPCAVLALASLAVAPGLAGCTQGTATLGSSPSSHRPADVPDVLLRVAPSGAIEQAGSAEVILTTRQLQGGRVTTTIDSLDGRGALDFPAYSADPTAYPRAAVAVVPAESDAALDPGTRDVSWGARLRLDETSFEPGDARVATGVDNGDNLVQRGLSGDPAFLKAEVDGRHPACTVTGDEGTLSVRAEREVRPGVWYAVRCVREGDRLTVDVRLLEADQEGPAVRTTAEGPVGAVRFGDPSTPISVGGKIGTDGNLIADATDQFNGQMVDPYLTIDE